MKRPVVVSTCTLVTVIQLAGCSADDDLAATTEVEQIQSTLRATTRAREVHGKDFIDARGRRWQHVKKATFLSEPEQIAALEKYEKPQTVAPSKEKDESAMTLDELAEALRATTLIGEHEYRLAEPDYEGARRVLAHRERSARAKPVERAPSAEPAESDDDVVPEELIPRGLDGADNRFQHRNNTEYPFRTQVWLTNGNKTSRCSGTLIGPRHMISAAHCFHSNSGGSSGWLDLKHWAPGVDSQDSNRYSYKPGSNYPSTAATLIEGCYLVTIPSRFAEGSTDDQYDYAVVEFQCNYRPGNAVGWIGVAKPDNSDLNGQKVYGYGYPRGVVSDFGCPGDSDCNWPQIWGMGHTGSLTYSGSTEVQYDVDTSGGQSGMGMYRVWDSLRFVVAIHQGKYTGLFDDHNRGRRMTEVVFDFLEANTDWQRDHDVNKRPSTGIGHD